MSLAHAQMRFKRIQRTKLISFFFLLGNNLSNEHAVNSRRLIRLTINHKTIGFTALFGENHGVIISVFTRKVKVLKRIYSYAVYGYLLKGYVICFCTLVYFCSLAKM